MAYKPIQKDTLPWLIDKRYRWIETDMQIKGFYRWHNRKHRSDGLSDGYLTSDGFTDDGNDLMEFLFYPADGSADGDGDGICWTYVLLILCADGNILMD